MPMIKQDVAAAIQGFVMNINVNASIGKEEPGFEHVNEITTHRVSPLITQVRVKTDHGVRYFEVRVKETF